MTEPDGEGDQIRSNNNNNSNRSSNSNSNNKMSSIIFGLPLRKSLRISAIIGICLSIIYIMLGTIIFTSILQPPTFSQNDSLNEIYYKIMIYRGNDLLLRTLTVILLTVNLVQIVSDLLLIDGTLKGRNGRHYWICFILDIILWLISLVCYVMIFYGSGFLLLIIVLFGTGVRGFILYLLHEFIAQLRKSNDSVEALANNVT